MNTFNFKFYANRYKFLAFSGILLSIGLIFLAIFGARLDIQFRGGSIITYSYQGNIDLQKVEKSVEKVLSNPVTVQEITSLDANENNKQITSIVISVAGNEALSTDESLALTQALTSDFKDNNFELTNSQLVNPFIGQRTLSNGLLAVLIASVLIVLYVWIRFRAISGASAGVFSLLALLHDVILAFFTFIVMRIDLNETVIAVVLSILGWSVNDTIVIFDRIRENEARRNNKMSLPDLVDLSINQSLTRSINTSLASFMAVTVAYIFAAVYQLPSIKEFALPMMVGILVGSYSSLCIATPFWAAWKTRGGRSGYEQ